MRLKFISGDAQARLNQKMDIKEIKDNLRGTLAVIYAD